MSDKKKLYNHILVLFNVTELSRLYETWLVEGPCNSALCCVGWRQTAERAAFVSEFMSERDWIRKLVSQSRPSSYFSAHIQHTVKCVLCIQPTPEEHSARGPTPNSQPVPVLSHVKIEHIHDTCFDGGGNWTRERTCKLHIEWSCPSQESNLLTMRQQC